MKLKPSLKQLAARRKFVAMVRKKAKAKKRDQLGSVGAVAKKTAKKKTGQYHKDTKSHNVNIRVVSGLDKVVKKGTKTAVLYTNFSRKISGLFDTSVINDIDQLKKEYFVLAKKYHPDAGGTTAQFQQLQAEYEKHLKTLLSGSKLSKEDQANEIELDKALRDAANALAGLPGINIELAGKWLWVTGNTYPIRSQLKQAGFLFASTKKAWFYKGIESKGRGQMSLEDIKAKYGAKTIMPEGSKQLKGIGSISGVKKTKLVSALKKAAKALNKRPI